MGGGEEEKKEEKNRKERLPLPCFCLAGDRRTTEQKQLASAAGQWASSEYQIERRPGASLLFQRA